MKKMLAKHVAENPKILRLYSLQSVIVASIAFTCVSGFHYIIKKLRKNNMHPFRTDIRIMNFLDSASTEKLSVFMKSISKWSSPKRISIVAGATFVFSMLNKKEQADSYMIPVITLGSLVLYNMFKVIYHRDRPSNHRIGIKGYSFPSGHAMMSSSFYGFMMYLAWKKIPYKGISLLISFNLLALILLIGISRPYLHAHYPSDVLAGYAAGVFWLISSVSSVSFFERNRK